jgi:hypothetical protein
LGRKRKWEYFRLIYGRYGKADRKAKHEMLNEFCLTTGYQRKYAIRILNGPAPGKRRDRPVRKRGPSYGHELLSVLTSVWEAAGYPWSVRLIALLSAWMPWIRKRFKLSDGETTALDQSAADGPSPRRQEEPTEAADLRAHQAGLSAEASHPGEDRQVGREVPRLHGS